MDGRMDGWDARCTNGTGRTDEQTDESLFTHARRTDGRTDGRGRGEQEKWRNGDASMATAPACAICAGREGSEELAAVQAIAALRGISDEAKKAVARRLRTYLVQAAE